MLTPHDDPKDKGLLKQSFELRLLLGFIVCAGALLVFGLLAKNILESSWLVQLDQNVEIAVHAWGTPQLVTVFKIITVLGFQVLLVVVAAVTLYYIVKRQRGHLIIWLVAFVGAQLLNELLKRIFARPRPIFSDPYLVAINYSFPSGHAMISLVVYGLLAFFILLEVHSALKRTAIIIFTVLLVLLIGISRIYLGVHYFSDIAGGYMVGAAWLAVCISAMNVFDWRSQRRASLINTPTKPTS
ncbi:MAG: phosphatase PAP2 family protein [Chloroflexota bacterium]